MKCLGTSQMKRIECFDWIKKFYILFLYLSSWMFCVNIVFHSYYCVKVYLLRKDVSEIL